MQIVKLLKPMGKLAKADSLIELKNPPHLILNCQTEKSANFANKQLQKFIGKSINKLTDAQAEHIVDWLDSDDSPKKIARMSVPQALEGSKKWQEKLNKIKAVKVDEQFIELAFQPTDPQFRIVKLVGKEAFEREGNLMRHCVASYFGRSNCTIFSLRDSKNEPHCTIELGDAATNVVAGLITRPEELVSDDSSERYEMEGGNYSLSGGSYIRQMKGKLNQDVKPEYVQPVVEFLISLGVNIEDSQISYIGYEAFSKSGELIKRLEKSRGKIIRKISIANKIYYFKKDLYGEKK